MHKKTNELDWLLQNAHLFNISAFEKAIGCPSTTIQKFIDGKRNLPVKWQKKLMLFIQQLKK